jgi:hypothetical protein
MELDGTPGFARESGPGGKAVIMQKRSWQARSITLQAAMLLGALVAAADTAAQDQPASAAPVVVRQGTPIPDEPRPVERRKAPAGETLAPGDAPEEAQSLNPMAHRCFVRDVMAFYDRTHVRCYNAANGRLVYFAVDTGQPVAETLLVKAWKSMRSGKPLQLKYAPTSDLNPPNCKPRDCRRLIDAAN